MENRVIYFTSHEMGEEIRDKGNPVPIQFRMEITPDGKLGPLTATDADGNNYDVGMKLHLKEAVTGMMNMCCCSDNGKLYCYQLLGGQQCVCEPK